MQEGGNTPQFSKIEQRVPAMDWSRLKPPVVSLTPQSNLTVADTVGFPSNSFSSTVVHSWTLSPGHGTPGMQSGTIEVPASSERMIRGSDRNNHVYTPSGLLLHRVGGVDERGSS